MEMKNLDKIIRSFREDLPTNSKTAAAIDRNESLEEISRCAEEEGLHQLAAVLFEAEQEALNEASGSVPAEDRSINIADLLSSFRKDIPKNSKTAAAIDRNESLEEISKCAEEEGLHELATVLFQARQQSLGEE